MFNVSLLLIISNLWCKHPTTGITMIHIDELNEGILLPQILLITLHIACLHNVSTLVVQSNLNNSNPW